MFNRFLELIDAVVLFINPVCQNQVSITLWKSRFLSKYVIPTIKVAQRVAKYQVFEYGIMGVGRRSFPLQRPPLLASAQPAHEARFPCDDAEVASSLSRTAIARVESLSLFSIFTPHFRIFLNEKLSQSVLEAS